MGLFGGAFKGANLGKTLGLLGGGLLGGVAGGGPGVLAGGVLGSQLLKLLGHRGGMKDVHKAVMDLPEDPEATGRPMPSSFSEIMDQLNQLRARRQTDFGGRPLPEGVSMPPWALNFRGGGR